MMAYRLQSPDSNESPDSNVAAAMASDRLRMQADLVEVIAGAQRTLAQSRALLTEVEAILAREKLPLWVARS
jgi:hypothetical protein